MPTYQYTCKDCGNDLEVVQKFSDPSLTVCPTCEGELRKVYNAVGVVFKGSGFYATDNRTKSSSTAAHSDASTASADKGTSASTSSSGSETKSATPAAATPAASPAPTAKAAS